ncbi:hypothetical protein ABMX48_25930 [Streptomyces cavourensis]|uniref:hypothetical protein n=1 Tax=Streptomyces sp. CAI-24 TaxID=2712892 RepID=UPI001586B9A6|nr:hypothetical protein [Streptomyces sp. CAI-24]NUV44627.1 hypothetical protein [Streptomyces sp. CAI-24]
MPRPTAAQLVYGSATVVCTTLALLLLSSTESGIGVAIAATTGLALGLLVAVRLPQPRPAADHPRTAPAGAPTRTHHLPDAFGAQERVPAARPGRQDEHSLHR